MKTTEDGSFAFTNSVRANTYRNKDFIGAFMLLFSKEFKYEIESVLSSKQLGYNYLHARFRDG